VSKWLDPQQHPIRSGLFIQTIGALVAVFIVYVASRLGLENFFRTTIQVYLWLFVFISAVALLAFAFQLRGWGIKGGSRRIVIVVPALSQNGWFAELIQELFRRLHLDDYDVILKIPYEDFSREEQLRIFKHLERHPNEYQGGIIVVYKHEQITKEITELCNAIAYPIVFADVRPFESRTEYPENAAFVGYDAVKIGEAAAKRVARYLREAGPERPEVKVICTEVSQTKRQDAFCEKLREMVPGVNIEVKREGEFRRSNAKNIAVKFFKDSLDSQKYVDAVFCTNDEMALGVYDAMLTVNYVGYKHPFLIGVDGTKSAKRLIINNDAHFDATIVQSTKELSQKIVDLLNRKIRKDMCPTEISLDPKMYDKEIAQAEENYY
jgi:ribose transport system substrate-binding protein